MEFFGRRSTFGRDAAHQDGEVRRCGVSLNGPRPRHDGHGGDVVRLKQLAILGALTLGCNGDGSISPDPLLTATPFDLASLGIGRVPERFTGELWVRGSTAYTTTWGSRNNVRGNGVKIWNVSSNTPVLVDSVIISDVTTLGDIQTTPDGKYLVVATEPVGSLVIYDVTSPRSPVLVTRFQHALIANGVHTSEVQQVNG